MKKDINSACESFAGYASSPRRLSDRGGSSPVPSARRPLRQCRLRRRLWVYRVGVMILRRRAVVSGWRSGLTSVVLVAPAALCALVTCGQQYILAKVTSGSSAEHAFVYRIECGRWASHPGEASRPRARAVTCGHVASPDPPGGVSVFSLLRVPHSMWVSRTPWGVRGPQLFGPECFLLWDTWRYWTCLEREAGSVPLVW